MQKRPTFDEAMGAVRTLIAFAGDNPERPGLQETPLRVVRSYATLFGGYKLETENLLKQFEGEDYDQMIVVKDIEFYSTCVVGSTFVETPAGRVPISRLSDGDFVYSFDEASMCFTLERCQRPRITQRDAELVRVYTDRDSLLCTPDHRVLVYSDGAASWKEAQYLQLTDRVVSLYRVLMNGYVHLNLNTRDGAPLYVPEHRMVWEAANDRSLGRRHVHHIDGVKSNNDPRNLTALSASEHSRLHREAEERTGFALRDAWTDEQRASFEARRKAALAASHADPVRRKAMLDKRAASMRAYWAERGAANAANHKVIAVERVPWREDVWCMDVPVNRNFIANGMVVHNCEHHMQPFFGRAHIAYIPRDNVYGVSKLARVLEVHARRLQIQERICQHVARDLYADGLVRGAGCVLEAKHFCMVCRGVQKQNSVMQTIALEGCFKEVDVKAEFLTMIK